MPIFIGGRLKLKGVKAIGSGSSTKKDSKKTLSASTTTTTTTTTSSKEEKKEKSSWIGKAVDVENEESFLTDVQRRHREKTRQIQRERVAKKLTETSYRDRLDAFNHKLATETEHNDIPRVSAAGNG
jgi:protein FAM32A